MNKVEQPYPLAIATAHRNIRLIARAIDVCTACSGSASIPEVKELQYLHDHLYGIVIRLEAAQEPHPVYDELFNDLLDLTLSLILAYENVWKIHPTQLGQYLILSPGPLRGEIEMSYTEQELLLN